MDYTGLMPEYIRLYIFDLDGTLIDSLADLTDAVNDTLVYCGLPKLDSDVVRRGVGIGARNLLFRSFAMAAKIAGADCPPGIAATGICSDPDPLTANERSARYPGFADFVLEVLPRYREIYNENCTRKTSLYPGIRDWLEYLSSRKIKMAILSNKPELASIRILQALGVDRYFAVIAGPETIGALKPDPSGIFRIMKITGITANCTAMIGDSDIDIATGRNAGVLTCGITAGLGDDIILRAAKPDVLIER